MIRTGIAASLLAGIAIGCGGTSHDTTGGTVTDAPDAAGSGGGSAGSTSPGGSAGAEHDGPDSSTGSGGGNGGSASGDGGGGGTSNAADASPGTRDAGSGCVASAASACQTTCGACPPDWSSVQAPLGCNPPGSSGWGHLATCGGYDALHLSYGSEGYFHHSYVFYDQAGKLVGAADFISPPVFDVTCESFEPSFVLPDLSACRDVVGDAGK